MTYFVPCECGHGVEVTAASAGSAVTCLCGRSVTIPALSTLRKRLEEEEERSPPSPPETPIRRWLCPKCMSENVEKQSSGQISPFPGYLCLECGLKMRGFGTFPIYYAVIIIGLLIFAGITYQALSEEGIGNNPVRILWFAGIALVGAGYSLLQLARPVPLRLTIDDAASLDQDPN